MQGGSQREQSRHKERISGGFPRFPRVLSSRGVPIPAKRKVKEKEPKLRRRSTTWGGCGRGTWSLAALPGAHMILPLPGPQGAEPEGQLRAQEQSPPPGQLATVAVCPGTPLPSVKSQGVGPSSQVACIYSNWPCREAVWLPWRSPEICTEPTPGGNGRGLWVWNGRSSRTTLDLLQSLEEGSF